MENNKLKVILDYKKLSQELKEQVKLTCSTGFSNYLTSFKNKEGHKVTALRFETDEKIYMLRMSEDMVMKLLENDSQNSNGYYTRDADLLDEGIDYWPDYLLYINNYMANEDYT